jgi:hypothetical protein
MPAGSGRRGRFYERNQIDGDEANPFMSNRDKAFEAWRRYNAPKTCDLIDSHTLLEMLRRAFEDGWEAATEDETT